jgi:D-aminoacyl-tRNA deacylase
MPLLVYSITDPTSVNIADAVKSAISPKEERKVNGNRLFRAGSISMLEIKTPNVTADFVDSVTSTDLIIFLSRHSSNRNIPSYTVHAEGNWSDEARVGGMPKQLSVAAPEAMLRILKKMKEKDTSGIGVTYEATHHGPLLKTPSLFAEIGGNEPARSSKELAAVVSDSIIESMDCDAEYDKVALGIGGLHYADRFAKRALQGKYAFGHIMSKHYVENTDMIRQAYERSNPKPEIAVIEWDCMSGAVRERALKVLDDLGIDHEKI